MTFKHFFFKSYGWHFILGLSATSLVFFRVVRTNEIKFVFLVWNLFLAAIPLGISWLISKTDNRWGLLILFIGWLLFLPNASYILTDFIHLKYSYQKLFLFDFILIGFFAALGLLWSALSMVNVTKSIQQKLNVRWTHTIMIIVSFLCGIGIYLGRIIRWNSWDIISRPDDILLDVVSMFLNPIDHLFAWEVAAIFGLITYASFLVCYKTQKYANVRVR